MIKIITLAILFTVQCMLSDAQYDPNHVTHLLKIMKDFGEAKLKERKSEGSVLNQVNQFLVATVVSEGLLSESANWGNDRLQGMYDSKKLRVVLNDPKCPSLKTIMTKGRTACHGEIIYLYCEEYINDMLGKIQENEQRFVVLYSHYIPCAGITGLGYSCAEELGSHALSCKGKYTMLVGWGEEFRNTNVQRSKDFMALAGLHLFTFENGAFKKDEHVIQANAQSKDETYQRRFFNCLNIVLEECCIDNGQNKQDRDKILIEFINNMFYKCTKDSNRFGELTEGKANIIQTCIIKYTDAEIGYGCKNCDKQTIVYHHRVCALYSWKTASYLGKPQSNDKADWKIYKLDWKDLYPQNYNCISQMDNKMPLCYFRPLTPGSLCTKLGLPKSDKSSKEFGAYRDINEFQHPDEDTCRNL